MINSGICGFKCFLIHSGVDDFQHVTEDDLHIAMKELQGHDTVLLVILPVVILLEVLLLLF